MFDEMYAKGLTFQSTLPARGATLASGGRRNFDTFQSTLPARGATAEMMKNLISMLIILGIFPYVNMANEKKAEF